MQLHKRAVSWILLENQSQFFFEYVKLRKFLNSFFRYTSLNNVVLQQPSETVKTRCVFFNPLMPGGNKYLIQLSGAGLFKYV